MRTRLTDDYARRSPVCRRLLGRLLHDLGAAFHRIPDRWEWA
jgi:hypothetical protein